MKVFRRNSDKGKSVRGIGSRKANLTVHILKKDYLEKLVMEGKITWKKGRG